MTQVYLLLTSALLGNILPFNAHCPLHSPGDHRG